MATNTSQFYQYYNIQPGMQQAQPAKPPTFSVQQIEQLARSIYAAVSVLNYLINMYVRGF